MRNAGGPRELAACSVTWNRTFTEANALVREALERADTVEIREAFAQRYLGCGMPSGKTLLIHGVPGNDMACYMDGGAIEVFGNAGSDRQH